MARALTVIYTSLILSGSEFADTLEQPQNPGAAKLTLLLLLGTGSWKQTQNSTGFSNTPCSLDTETLEMVQPWWGSSTPALTGAPLPCLALCPHSPRPTHHLLRAKWDWAHICFWEVLGFSAVPIARSFCCNTGKSLGCLGRAKVVTAVFMWQPNFQVLVP